MTTAQFSVQSEFAPSYMLGIKIKGEYDLHLGTFNGRFVIFWNTKDGTICEYVFRPNTPPQSAIQAFEAYVDKVKGLTKRQILNTRIHRMSAA